MDADFEEISVALAENGTTSFLATTMSDSYENMLSVSEQNTDCSGFWE